MQQRPTKTKEMAHFNVLKSGLLKSYISAENLIDPQV